MSLLDETRTISQPRTHTPRDQDLVESLHRIAAGDQQSFAALYDALSGDIRHLAAVTFTDSRAVESVVAATFLQLWRQAPTPDPAHVRAWLVSVASSLIAQRLKTEPQSSASGRPAATWATPWGAMSSTLDECMDTILASRLNRRSPRVPAQRPPVSHLSSG
jgi:DNA-directed RNA polymerase specialized sigma24 family protein